MSEQEMIARAVKDILRGPDGEEYTDAGMEDAFFRWPVIERAILTTLASRTPGMVMVPREPTEAEKAARQLYIHETANDPVIHCNRFPAWEELSEKSRDEYRRRVPPTPTPSGAE